MINLFNDQELEASPRESVRVIKKLNPHQLPPPPLPDYHSILVILLYELCGTKKRGVRSPLSRPNASVKHKPLSAQDKGLAQSDLNSAGSATKILGDPGPQGIGPPARSHGGGLVVW